MGSAAGRELGGEGAGGLPTPGPPAQGRRALPAPVRRHAEGAEVGSGPAPGAPHLAPAEAELEAVPRSRAHPSAIEEGRGGEEEEEEGGGGEGAGAGGAGCAADPRTATAAAEPHLPQLRHPCVAVV